MRRALALIALLSAACADTVILGTECVTGGGTCEQIKPAPGGEGVDAGGAPSDVIDGGEEPPAANLDSGGDEQPPAEPPRDSGGRPPRDASFFPIRDAARPLPVPADAGPAEFPAFSNPSFELVDGGREGMLVETSQGAQSPYETSVAPWYVCRGGTSVASMVSYTFGLPPRTTMVAPRDGNTFITDTIPLVAFSFGGLTQELGEPLVPGKRYAFAVDVFAQPDALMFREFVLELRYADSFGCFFGFIGYPLAMTTPITPGAWETKCIDFIAPQPDSPLSRNGIRHVILMASVPLDPVNFSPLHFDNIRPHAMCGNAVPATP